MRTLYTLNIRRNVACVGVNAKIQHFRKNGILEFRIRFRFWRKKKVIFPGRLSYSFDPALQPGRPPAVWPLAVTSSSREWLVILTYIGRSALSFSVAGRLQPESGLDAVVYEPTFTAVGMLFVAAITSRP